MIGWIPKGGIASAKIINIFKILIQIVGTLLQKTFTSLHFYKPVAGPLLLEPWLTKRSVNVILSIYQSSC